MNNVTYLHPAPWSPLPLTHPARAYTSAENTNVAETIAAFRLQHSPIQYGDDYDAVERTAHLDMMMEFSK